MSVQIEKIIVKYLNQSATAKDLDLLFEWIKLSENKKIFRDFVQTHYAISYNMNDPDHKKTLEELLFVIKKEKSLAYRIKNKIGYRYAAAAMIIGLIFSVYLFKDKIFHNRIENNEPVIVNNEITPGVNKAILTLDNGSQLILEKGNTVHTQNAESNGEALIYEAKKKNDGEVAYNNLTIPRGGYFFIKLSDGTKIWLNSDSKLKYPVSFNKGETRKVELVYGEAFFDVSPSTINGNSKFVVINESQEIVVMGTEFNVKAYKDESNIYTTLVKGIVSVNFSNRQQIIIPNQQLNYNLDTKKSSIKKVDVSNEISWKEGLFNFNNKSLREIMKVLSRWYDIDVVFENKQISDEEFVGSLSKDQNIEDILSSIKNFGIIKEYTIIEKTIILK
ncbi:FecR family protein [Aureibaculum algae]|uniref:FecR family protein n=1 Tax=Aureibaculum algae TaxID=2584122 RepID=A0A5B7TLB0_9FLAO|nr:FecR family protein [Aureibaculum algae]QCX37449.1 FecR family protein [Aureibaculum algae]